MLIHNIYKIAIKSYSDMKFIDVIIIYALILRKSKRNYGTIHRHPVIPWSDFCYLCLVSIAFILISVGCECNWLGYHSADLKIREDRNSQINLRLKLNPWPLLPFEVTLKLMAALTLLVIKTNDLYMIKSKLTISHQYFVGQVLLT